MHVLGLLSHCVDNSPGHLYFVIYEGEVLQGLARAGVWRGGGGGVKLGNMKH